MDYQEKYSSMEILYYDEWKALLVESIKEYEKLIHKYTERILDTENQHSPKMIERYKERIDDMAQTVAYNMGILDRAEIEKDYLVFYKEDNRLGMVLETGEIKDKIYQLRKERDKMSV